MKDQISDLNQLLKKFKSEVETLEKQIEEKTINIRIVYEALKLLQDEMSTQPVSIKLSAIPKVITESLSEKYKGMGINKAILDILSNSDKYLDGSDIFEELIKNGFTSASSNKRRDVYISLYRMHKENRIVSIQRDDRKKYMIKQAI